MRAPSAVLALTFYLCISSNAVPVYLVEGPVVGQEGLGYEVEGAPLPEGSLEVHLPDGLQTWQPGADEPPPFFTEGSPPTEGESRLLDTAKPDGPPPPPEGEAPPESNDIPVYRESGRRPEIDPKHRQAGFWDSFNPTTDPEVPKGDKAPTTRVYYSTKYTEGGLNNKGGSRNIAVTIPGGNEQFIVENMGKWSDNTFEAKFSDKDSHIIFVSPVKPVKTVNDAIEANKWAKKFVQTNVQKLGHKA